MPLAAAGELATDFKDKTVPLAWQTSMGLGSAPVVVSDNRIYSFGLYKTGTKTASLSDPSSMPTMVEMGSGSLKLHDVPGTPDWVIKELENYPADLYRGDEYAQCLDAITGKKIWATKLTDWGIAYPSNQPCGDIASPAIANGKIVFHSATGTLYCLNLSDGTKLWEVNLWDHEMYNWSEKQMNGSGPLIIDGTVIVSYVGVSDARWKEILAGHKRSDWSPGGGQLLVLSGFDLQTGKRKWICKPDIGGFRLMSSRIGYAVIENHPTVLVPCGAATYGVDPASGKKRWEFDVVGDRDGVKKGRGLWAPYGSYAPVAYGNYVIDSVSNAHDDIESRTWCVEIINDKPKLVWQTSDFVPFTECMKSNLLIQNGKLYGFDAHGVWDDPGLPSEQRWLNDRAKPHNEPGRNLRPCGSLQCREVKSGKLLWSADPINYIDRHGKAGDDWYPTQSIISGSTYIAWNKSGLLIMRLKGEGVDLLAQGPPDYYNVWHTFGFGSEPVLVNGLLYLRTFLTASDGKTNDYNLSCYDLRAR